MHFRVRHTTRYRYSKPVFLEPHTVRLRPRCDGSQRLQRFQLRIDPEPAIFTEVLDSEGNDVAYTWFEATAEELLVDSEFEVETLRENPFDYIMLDDKANHLPLSYPAAWRDQLAPYLASSPPRRWSRRKICSLDCRMGRARNSAIPGSPKRKDLQRLRSYGT